MNAMPMILPPATFEVPAIIRVAGPSRPAPAVNTKPAVTFKSGTHVPVKPNDSSNPCIGYPGKNPYCQED
jgi:hypothetical protein